MIFLDYFDKVIDGFEFLIAFFSILALLGLVIGILGLKFDTEFRRNRYISLIVVSFIILGICGPYTGIKYFRMNV